MSTGWQEIVDALGAGSPTLSCGDRIRTDAANDEDPYPFIVGHSYSTERDFGLDGTLLSTKELFHVELWGETREQANQLEAEVLERLIAADLLPEPNGPDGFDPTVDVRCVDLFVPTWITPAIP